MGDATGTTSGPGVLLLSRSWGRPADEAAFVSRSVAGAASRHGPVQVLVPGPFPGVRADGLFDLQAVGGGPDVGGPGAAPTPEWPDPGAATLPGGRGATSDAPGLVLVERGDDGALGIARRLWPGVPVVAIGADPGWAGADGCLAVGPPPDAGPDAGPETGPDAGPDAGPETAPGGRPAHGGGRGSTVEVDLYVPVNPLAAEHRHNGIGFVDYVLVLTDRAGRGPGAPPPAAAWLAAAAPTEHLLVVEGGVATVWRHRARRGVIGVDSRTDLWRLMAFARVTVDLRPGALVARECVESLRLGTPVVVPAHSTAAPLARAGGGHCFDDVRDLLGGVDALGDTDVRRAAAERGRAAADATYGDAARFVDLVGAALAHFGAAA